MSEFFQRLGLLFCGFALMIVPAAAISVSADGLSGRLVVGYQGWFGCPGDFEGNKDWQHWFANGVAADHLLVDVLPSVRSLEPSGLCDTGLIRADGQGTIKLFSAQSASVVAAHFQWMSDHGIDGAAVQRFITGLSDPAVRRRRDHVLKNEQGAAEATGRVFFVVYDISGADGSTVTAEVRRDWRHLAEELQVIASSAYLRDHGKPLVELWGFGVKGRPGAAADVKSLIEDLKLGKNGLAAATVIGGVPSGWRALEGDAAPEQQWASVFRAYDVISPWSVGRFADEAGADAFMKNSVEPDLAEVRRLGLRYLPVVFPGFSWSNLMKSRGKPEQAILNRTPRNCGRFMWRQFSNLLAAHVESLYVAMFDEVDEGTAIFPAETRSDKLPRGAGMVYLNQDGCQLPDDWYLRVTGSGAGFLHKSATPPPKLEAVLRP